MKRLWIAVGILLLVTAACISALFWQLHAIDRLERALHGVETAVKASQPDAIEKAEAFAALCTETTEKIAALSRHVDSFPLRESACQLPLLLRQGNTDQFFAEAERCRFYLQELQRNELPTFSNIF